MGCCATKSKFKNLILQHQNQIDLLQIQKDQELQALQHQNQINLLKIQKDNELQILQNQNQIDSLQKQKDNELQIVRTDLLNQKKKHDNEIAALKIKHQSQVKDLKQQNENSQKEILNLVQEVKLNQIVEILNEMNERENMKQKNQELENQKNFNNLISAIQQLEQSMKLIQEQCGREKSEISPNTPFPKAGENQKLIRNKQTLRPRPNFQIRNIPIIPPNLEEKRYNVYQRNYIKKKFLK